MSLSSGALRFSCRLKFHFRCVDIEGSEHEVVPWLLQTGAWKYIDALVLEHHHWHGGYSQHEKEDLKKDVEELKKLGVLMPDYYSDA